MSRHQIDFIKAHRSSIALYLDFRSLIKSILCSLTLHFAFMASISVDAEAASSLADEVDGQGQKARNYCGFLAMSLKPPVRGTSASKGQLLGVQPHVKAHFDRLVNGAGVPRLNFKEFDQLLKTFFDEPSVESRNEIILASQNVIFGLVSQFLHRFRSEDDLEEAIEVTQLAILENFQNFIEKKLRFEEAPVADRRYYRYTPIQTMIGRAQFYHFARADAFWSLVRFLFEQVLTPASPNFPSDSSLNRMISQYLLGPSPQGLDEAGQLELPNWESEAEPWVSIEEYIRLFENTADPNQNFDFFGAQLITHLTRWI